MWRTHRLQEVKFKSSSLNSYAFTVCLCRRRTEGTRYELSYQLMYSAVEASKGATSLTRLYLRAVVSWLLELCQDWRCLRWVLASHNQHWLRSTRPLSMTRRVPTANGASNVRSTVSCSSSKSRLIHHYDQQRQIRSWNHSSAVDSACCFLPCSTCCFPVHFPRITEDCLTELRHASRGTRLRPSDLRPFDTWCRRVGSSCLYLHWLQMSHLLPSWLSGCCHCFNLGIDNFDL